MFKKILIVGCGLIGSSILRATIKKKISKKIYILERSKNHIDRIIVQEIDDLFKKQEIITALIKVPNSDLKNCIELDKVKFPELTERVENIEQKIYSLRSKLDSPHSGDLTPICN